MATSSPAKRRSRRSRSEPKQKLFVIRKYVMAESATEAIRKERKRQVDDCFLHNGWEGANLEQLESAVGFEIDNTYDNED